MIISRTFILAIALAFSFSMNSTPLPVSAEDMMDWTIRNNKIQQTGRNWEEIIGAESDKYYAIEREQTQKFLYTREEILEEREQLKAAHGSKGKNPNVQPSISMEQQNILRQRLKDLDLQ